MKWKYHEDYRWGSDKLRLCEWELDSLIYNLKRKNLEIGGKKCKSQLTPEEELLIMALENLRDSYRRKDNYNSRKERQNKAKHRCEELEKTLLEVTEERDTLRDKIKEAQIASGLFIQSVRKKLGLGSE